MVLLFLRLGSAGPLAAADRRGRGGGVKENALCGCFWVNGLLCPTSTADLCGT